jgi:hypothetical protein
MVFVIFFLLQREDLRDRFIRLAGAGDLRRTTIALDDAARRLSRYLLTQTAINTSLGVVVGTGLWSNRCALSGTLGHPRDAAAFRPLYRPCYRCRTTRNRRTGVEPGPALRWVIDSRGSIRQTDNACDGSVRCHCGPSYFGVSDRVGWVTASVLCRRAPGTILICQPDQKPWNRHDRRAKPQPHLLNGPETADRDSSGLGIDLGRTSNQTYMCGNRHRANGFTRSSLAISISASSESGTNDRSKQHNHNHEPNQCCDGQTKDDKDCAKHDYEKDRKQSSCPNARRAGP